MALIELEISKNWFTGTIVREPNWDNIRVPVLEYADNTNRNLEQITRDAFGVSYELDNDGNANLSIPLIDAMANLAENETVTGAWTFAGNTTFNSTRLRIRGAGAGIATLTNTNTADSRTLTLPDTGANTGVLVDEHFPIGSFLFFSDYNGTLAMPNATIWHLCNGAAIADAASPLNGITPLDMTGRYLTGFTTGVEGDGSIGAAGNSNVAVGNVAHQVNLSHTHTGPNHFHPLGADAYARLNFDGVNWYAHLTTRNFTSTHTAAVVAWAVFAAGVTFPCLNLAGDTESGGTGATGASGSATQSIQPRSVQCRVYVRKR